MDKGVLGRQQDGGDDLLVGQRGHLVGEGVLLDEGGVDPTRVDPLGLRAPPRSVPAVHGAGDDGLDEEREGEDEADQLHGLGKLPTTWARAG